MNMFAKFDENPAMTLQDIKKTLRTDGRTHAHTDNVKTVYPPQTKFAGGIKNCRMLQGECSAILLTFIKLPSYHLSFCLLLSGRCTQVLLLFC